MLRPDTPKEGTPRLSRSGETPDHLSEPLGSEAKTSGLVMRPPSLTPNTSYALQATAYASDNGQFLAMHKGLYKAYWEDNLDIGNVDVVRSIADQIGLNCEELMSVLEKGLYEETIIGEYQEAIQLGVNSIPAFQMGRYLFTGARPLEAFKNVIDKVIQEGA